MAATAGTISAEVTADFAQFASQFQSGLNSALRGVTINMTAISNQITAAIQTAVNQSDAILRTLGQSASSVTGQISSATSSAASSTRSLADSFRSVGSEIASVGQTMTVALTLPVTTLGTSVVKTAGDFEQMMNKVKATTEASTEDFAAMRKEAIDLGSTTAYSATEASSAMYMLATAGFDTKEIMAALPDVLNMAAAGSTSLADAAEIASGIMNGFGFSASDLSSVNDMLTRTFLSTATTLESLGTSFKYVGPTAKSAGLSFAETAAAIGLLGNAGIKGSSAGTALNSAISRLLAPTGAVGDKLQELGVTVTDSAGKMLPLVDIMRQLERAGADTSDMITLFGLEAGPDMMALLGQGSTALADLTKEIENSGGTASKVAKTQMEGFNGALDEAKSAAEGLMIAIGDAGLLGWMTKLAKKVSDVALNLSTASPTVLNLATIAAIVVAAIGPVVFMVGKAVVVVGVLMKWCKGLSKAFTWIRTAILGISAPFAWAIVAIAAVAAAFYLAYKYIDGFRETVNRMASAVATAAVALWGAIQAAAVIVIAWFGRLWVAAQQLWQRMIPVFQEIGDALMSAWRQIIMPAAKGIASTLMGMASAVVGLWDSTFKQPITFIAGLMLTLGGVIFEWASKYAEPAFRTVAAVVSWFWNSVVRPALSNTMNLVKALASVFAWSFVTISVPAIKILVSYLTNVAQRVYATYLATKPIWDLLWTAAKTAFMAIVGAVVSFAMAFKNAWSGVSGDLTSFWNSKAMPIFMAIKAGIEALMVVVMWLWQNAFLPAFAGIRVAIGWLGVAIGYIFQYAPTVFRAIGAAAMWLWQNAIGPAFNAIVAVVKFVLSIFMWFWNTFGPLITALGQLVWAIINLVVVVAFNLFKLALLILAGIVIAAIVVIKAAFMVLGTAIMWVWNTLLKPAFDAFMAIVGVVWAVIGPYVMAIGAWFAQYLGPVISTIVDGIVAVFNWLWSMVVTIWNGITSFISGAVGIINGTAGGISSFVNSVIGFFTGLVNGVTDKVNALTSKVREIGGIISGALSGAGNWLYDAGRSIIQGLINGLDSMWGAVKSKASDIAGSIRDCFPFSPAKTGPLSGSGSPEIAGSKIVSMVADGMSAQLSNLRSVTGTVASATQLGVGQSEVPSLVTGSLPIAATAAGGGGANTYYLTVNALDPKSAARSVMDSINEWERSNGKSWRKPPA